MKNTILDYLDDAEAIACDYNAIRDIMDSIPSSHTGARLETFYNYNIRQNIYPSKDSFNEYTDYVMRFYNNKISQLKTAKAKAEWYDKLNILLKDMFRHEKHFHGVFEFTSRINDAKCRIIDTLNSDTKQKIFIETDGELYETDHEGYVVVDIVTGAALKLVDRQQFSFFNFSSEIKKGWEK